MFLSVASTMIEAIIRFINGISLISNMAKEQTFLLVSLEEIFDVFPSGRLEGGADPVQDFTR